MFVRLLIPFLTVAVTAAPGWAGEGDPSRGAVYVTAMCASCHSVSAETASSPNSAARPFREMELVSGEALANFFNTSHPNTSRLLKETQAEDIFSYVESLKTPQSG